MAGQASSDETAAQLTVYYPTICQPFFSLRLRSGEALDWLNAALPTARRLGNLYVATILNLMGLLDRAFGRHREAVAHFREALSAASSLENPESEGTLLGNLGNELVFVGEFEEAEPILNRLLRISRESGLDQEEMLALGGLERLYSELQRFDLALDYGRQWLEVARRSGSRYSEGQALGNMGVCHMHLESYREAISCFLDDLRISRELGDRWGEAACLGNLGWACHALGLQERAKVLLHARIHLSEELEDLRGAAESSWNLGFIYEEEDLPRAIELKQVMVDYKRSIQHPDAEELASEVDALRARLFGGS